MRISGKSILEIVSTIDATDRRILAIARSEFAARGFHSANMDAIAREADVGKGTIYRRFVSKQVLFFCVLEWLFREFMEVLDADEDAGGSAVERIERHVRRGRAFFTENMDIIRLYVHEQSRIIEGCASGELREWGINFHHRLFRFWTGLATDALREGALSLEEEPALLGSILGGMAHAIYSDMIISDGPVSDGEYERRENIFLHIIKNGLFSQGG